MFLVIEQTNGENIIISQKIENKDKAIELASKELNTLNKKIYVVEIIREFSC